MRLKSKIITGLAIITVILGVCSVVLVSAEGNSVLERSSEKSSANNELQSVHAIGRAMQHGDFELAREYLSKPLGGEAGEAATKRFKGLLKGYDKLMADLQVARTSYYQEKLDELHLKIKQAQWRKHMLGASEDYDFESKDKEKLETEFQDDISEDWLGALAQLGICHDIVEKMNLQDKVEPELREKIIARALEIADELEEDGKGLDAYVKVYNYLTYIDEEKYQYDDLYEHLQQQAKLKMMYVSDPNTEGVSWQEHRKGVSLDIIGAALNTLSLGYVDEPDYRQIAEGGIESILMLTETEEMNQIFERLNDAEMLKSFRGDIEKILENIKGMDETRFGSSHLQILLGRLMEINERTLDLPDEVILAEFSDGAFSTLDSYTYVVWPGDVADFRKDMTNEFSGVGILINKKKKDGPILVDSLVSFDAPAYKAGLDAGDRIIAIDGKDARKITLEKSVHLITGPTGTNVILTVDRDGFEEPRNFIVKRQHVVVPTVKGLYRGQDGEWQYFADPNNGIAYVQLNHFAGETPARLNGLLRRLGRKGMRGLVLDLRNNSGGYLSGAVSVVDTFVSSGKIVSSRYRYPQREDMKKATIEGTFDGDLPLVVLINSISASASEIVAGSLQDNKRALVVGTRSFGKGNVQTIQGLRDTDAQMKMTIAYYYLPSGRRVHRDPKDKGNKDYGVNPDVTVELTSKQHQDLADYRHKARILRRNDLPEREKKPKVFTADEMTAGDPQLQMALLCLRANILVESSEQVVENTASKL